MLHRGQGGPVDLFRARSLYEQAVGLGNMFALNNFAYMLHHGEGGPVDPVRARVFYEQAVGLGSQYAMNNLAYMLQNGDGGPVDSFRARALYERSAEAGNLFAMKNFALMLRSGLGGEINMPLAIFWINNAAILEKASEQRLIADLSALPEAQFSLLVDCFLPKLISGRCQLHSITADWFHHTVRQVIVLNYLEQHYVNNLEVLLLAVSPGHPSSSIFNRESKKYVKRLVKNIEKKETILLMWFSRERIRREKINRDPSIDPAILVQLLGIFNNHPYCRASARHARLDDDNLDKRRMCCLL